MTTAVPTLAARLNEACHCIWVDRERLMNRIAELSDGTSLAVPAGMVSGSVVFVDGSHVAAMDRTIALIHRVVASTAFEQRIATSAPAIARAPQAATGGVLGFDFHLGTPQPQLIEINTNPGGLLLGLEIARAATSACDCLSDPVTAMSAASIPLDAVADAVVQLFRDEYARARPSRSLRTVAIVDDAPTEQYLYPEFLLYRRLLKVAGIRVVIAGPDQLDIRGDSLQVGTDTVDLVYNRCTDFYLAQPTHAALRQAYERDLAVITPHPAAHARWADKRVLGLLRDEQLLRQAGLDDIDIAHLHATIPRTETVEPGHAEELWAKRKDLFFKPVDGYGGKAAYRGDKLTRKAFEHVVGHPYVAQAVAPTSSRRIPLPEGEETELRVDVRNFVYAGSTLLRSARLYRGQTTNFRTAGGGFAPVLAIGRQ